MMDCWTRNLVFGSHCPIRQARDITPQSKQKQPRFLKNNRMAREIHDTLAQAFAGILAQVGQNRC